MEHVGVHFKKGISTEGGYYVGTKDSETEVIRPEGIVVAPIASPRAEIAEAFIRKLQVDNGGVIGSGVYVGYEFPENPEVGQLFYHTDYEMLLSYNSSHQRWQPISAYRDVWLYVDGESGDDSNDGFYGSTAVKTIQAAVDRIPLFTAGNIYIRIIQAGEYEGAVISDVFLPGGKRLYIGGDYSTLTALGMINPTEIIRGNGATQGRVTKSGAGWETNAYANKWIGALPYPNAPGIGDPWRLIESNTADTITIVGTFSEGLSGMRTSVFYTPGVVISGNVGLRIVNCSNVILENLQCTSGLVCDRGSVVEIRSCRLSGDTGTEIYGGSRVSLRAVLCEHLLTVRRAHLQSYCSKFTLSDESYIRCEHGASVEFGGGSITDGSDGSPYGIHATKNSVVDCVNTDTDGYVRLKNHGTAALYASEGAQITGTGNNQYSGNEENAVVDSESYGYIEGQRQGGRR